MKRNTKIMGENEDKLYPSLDRISGLDTKIKLSDRPEIISN